MRYNIHITQTSNIEQTAHKSGNIYHGSTNKGILSLNMARVIFYFFSLINHKSDYRVSLLLGHTAIAISVTAFKESYERKKHAAAREKRV